MSDDKHKKELLEQIKKNWLLGYESYRTCQNCSKCEICYFYTFNYYCKSWCPINGTQLVIKEIEK